MNEICYKHKVGLLSNGNGTLRCPLCKKEKQLGKIQPIRKRFISPRTKQMSLIQINNTKNSNYFFIGYDFLEKAYFEILLDTTFCQYASTVGKYLEDFVGEWYLSQGFFIKKLYLLRPQERIKGLSDLLISKNGVERYVEVKSNTDSLKLEQFLFLDYKKGIIVWVVEESQKNKVVNIIKGNVIQ